MFVEDVSDQLIHMFVNEEEEYTNFKFGFASSYVRDAIGKQVSTIPRLEIVNFLEQHISSSSYRTLWGHMYEQIAHLILSRGGTFKRKKVFEDGRIEAIETFRQDPLVLVNFKIVQELGESKDDYPRGAYFQPSSLTFESVDAVIVPNTFVQYFKYSKGNHDYKLHGLKKLDKALESENYNVWSCVPAESYGITEFQNWLGVKGAELKVMRKKSRDLVKKIVQYVVEVDYRRYENLSPMETSRKKRKRQTTYLTDRDKEATPTAPAIASKQILPSASAPASAELQKFP
jgi:hypothetical protein